jgi:hypothetical protein
VPNIYLLLDLSTTHLPEHLRDDLDSVDGLTARALPFGWLLWVPEDPDAHAADYADAFPAEVLLIQRYARGLRCDYVLLDRDADTDDQLPTWD